MYSAVSDVAEIECEARLCHLKMWSDFAGYGFNLHADRATPGQYVGKVDEGSPAEAAGLRLNDRIVEVNGISVDGKSHADVVSAIKSVPGEVRLLVIDAATDEICRNNGVKVSAAVLTSVETIVCPDCRPTSYGTCQACLLLVNINALQVPYHSNVTRGPLPVLFN